MIHCHSLLFRAVFANIGAGTALLDSLQKGHNVSTAQCQKTKVTSGREKTRQGQKKTTSTARHGVAAMAMSLTHGRRFAHSDGFEENKSICKGSADPNGMAILCYVCFISVLSALFPMAKPNPLGTASFSHGSTLIGSIIAANPSGKAMMYP